MTYAGESLISSLTGFSVSSMLFTVFNLLTTCQSLGKRGQGDFVPKQEGDGETGDALRFLNTGVDL